MKYVFWIVVSCCVSAVIMLVIVLAMAPGIIESMK